MLGLLGTSFDDPKTMATLQLAQGLLGRGGSMQRLAGGLQGYGDVMGQAKAQEEAKRKAALQEQMMRLQLEQVLAQQERAKKADQQQGVDDTLMRTMMEDGSQGPAMPPDPRLMLARGGSMQGVQNLMALNSALAPKEKKRNVMNVNGTLVEVPDQGPVNPLFTAPKEAAPTDLAKMLSEMNALPPGSPLRAVYQQQIAKMTTHQPGVSVSYGAPQAGVDAQGNSVFFQPDKGGGAPAIVPGVRPPPSATGQKLTEGEAKATTFLSQMAAAERELATVPIDQNRLWSQVETGLASGPTNLIASEPAQRARQAQEQWAEAYLRFKTGAATTQDEIRRNVRTFFPAPGDDPKTVDQKRRAREQAVQDMKVVSGMGAQRVDTSTAPKAPAKINSEAEYNALPPGALYVGPDGKTRRKQ